MVHKPKEYSQFGKVHKSKVSKGREIAQMREMMAKMRVCVIGAGAAGLCVARHGLASPAVSEVVIFEGCAGLGGTWAYTEATDRDAHGRPIHSAMYKNMRTNLPKEVMAFPDFPFPKDQPKSFLHHTDVQSYLEDYAQHFNLLPHIRYGTDVTRVERVDSGWEVWSRKVGSEEDSTSSVFHATFVCNGHYARPHLPDIPGSADFAGLQMHSHQYRHPKPFRGERVAVLGSGPSGTDIAIDLAPFAKQVFMCHNRTPLESFFPENLEQRRGFAGFQGPSSILLNDGTRLDDMDSVVYCTGYEYDYPFLDAEKLGLQLSPTRGVSPVYQHLVFVKDPTLIFMGLCKVVCPFPQFDAQARFALWLLANPGAVSRTEMEEWVAREADFRSEEMPGVANQHLMGKLQWAYNSGICERAGLPGRIPPVVQRLYDEVHRYRVKNLCAYKDERFVLMDDDTFKHIV